MIDQPAADEFTPEVPPVDQERIERAVREMLLAIGEDPERDGLLGTPARVARMYAEQFAGLRQRPEDVLTTVFDEEPPFVAGSIEGDNQGYDQAQANDKGRLWFVAIKKRF